MQLAGFIACPADACTEIKEIANYVSPFCGGHGAVRDSIEFVLKRIGLWDKAIRDVYLHE